MSSSEEERVLDRQIGARLRQRRLMVGLSQPELGAAANISFQQIQKYETGKDRISVSKLVLIARKLDVPITYFVEDQGDR